MRSQVHHLISRSTAAHGDKAALSFADTTLTFDELWAAVASVGAGLQELGLDHGDRVAVYLDKRIETVCAIFGASVAGAVFVPINPLLRARQVTHILADCDARVLVTTAERYDLLREDLEQIKGLTHVVIAGAGAAKRGPIGNHELLTWDRVATPSRLPAKADAIGIDTDMAAILYTSGSTGSPKGVVLSHRNLIAGAESVSEYLGNGPNDVILAALPLSFDAGFSQLTTAFSSGAHVVLVNYLLPADVVRVCTRHGVTGLTCVPPLWIQLAGQAWPGEVAGTLRYIANTGGRMPRSTLERLRALFVNAQPYLMYGLTEAFRSTYLDPAEVDRRPDSIGKAIPNAEILVVRPDGSVCDAGEEGELVHRGALVALGYWNDQERTDARFRPAPGPAPGLTTTELAVWSGDSVVRDEDGFLYFVGRKDDMIKTSGYRVSPTEIEEVAYDTGMVRDAVAIGVDDAKLGQAVLLIVSPPPDEAVNENALSVELRRRLPLYMIPRQILIRDEIPRSPNGKFDRNLLRQEVSS
jgi:acyl-CoA ligase (AMP-forming) (exosortase A-associated)